MTPIILSGGSGTRLWPISRSDNPKQFCKFFERSLFVETLLRFKNYSTPIVVTSKNLFVPTLSESKEYNIPKENLIFEPQARNTAAAIALICHLLILQKKQDCVVGVFPADHFITDLQTFHEAINLGIEQAKKDEVVTFGIKPDFPSTGYGYIQIAPENLRPENKPYLTAALAFHEKPQLQLAEKFLSSGNYFWNSGMFLFKVSVMANHFKRLMPELWQNISSLDQNLNGLDQCYSHIKPESFDVGIVEKLKSLYCIPVSMGWSDLGTWDEMDRFKIKNNPSDGSKKDLIFNQEAKNNFVFSTEKKVYGFIGVENLIVVNTPDALLICKKGDSQKVKEIVEQMKIEGLEIADKSPNRL
ncbi:MAG: mannose-1-phosphate guanylyltransferase/mannose-6-phosphate isomerase [Bdellovibrionales bacterium]|nr:mannose-1-phosphate guanylyltransferase/mannose-6-phosphate isomerase [Bdellovibrionales bacterium]